MNKLIKNRDKKIHEWRVCPAGEIIIRRAHCAKNPSHKDVLSYDELHEVAKQHFYDLSGPPTAGVLKFKHSDDYDQVIRGWVRYWNDIFQFAEPLDPNIIKALIATESSFIADMNTPAKGNGHARGLMQLINPTLKL